MRFSGSTAVGQAHSSFRSRTEEHPASRNPEGLVILRSICLERASPPFESMFAQFNPTQSGTGEQKGYRARPELRPILDPLTSP